MFNRVIVLAVLFLAVPPVCHAGDQAEIERVRQELEALRQSYEHHIKALEARIESLESRQASEQKPEPPVMVAAEPVVVAAPAVQQRPSAFNPQIGVVLVGTASTYSRDADAGIPGYMAGSESGPLSEGFSLGESELNLQASIDDRFYGNFTLAVADEDGSTEVELEEAWFQTLALPYGMSLRGGRFFSGIGYRNQFHRHADDFVERSLPYRVFLENQYIDDGIQATWLAPTDQFLEFGGEWLRGEGFPAAGSANSGKGAWTLFARTGRDVGVSHSWQAGLSWLSADADDRHSGDEDGRDNFSGDVDLAIADLVWKWAPGGNPNQQNFKLEGAFFWQNQDGRFTPADESSLPYDEDQQGWYLDGVYQFRPHWRAGLRASGLQADDPGSAFDGTSLDTEGHDPRIYSAMVDWSPSEYSRLRLQYDLDQSAPQTVDRLYLQYIMGLGAHGAHLY